MAIKKWLIAGLLVVASVNCWSAETLSQLITNSRVLARDGASSTRQRFSDSQITELLNQGQREAITATRCLMVSYQFQLSVGTTYYPLPSNFISIARVTRNKYGAMTELSPAALDGRTRGWESASGSPTYYFVNFSSRGLIGFAVFPQTASDTDTIKVDYYAQANDMSASTDIPFNGVIELTDYQHALSYFAASLMSIIDGQFEQSKVYTGVFSSVITAMKSRCMDRPNYLPSTVASP